MSHSLFLHLFAVSSMFKAEHVNAETRLAIFITIPNNFAFYVFYGIICCGTSFYIFIIKDIFVYICDTYHTVCTQQRQQNN